MHIAKLLAILALGSCSPQESPKQIDVSSKKNETSTETDADVNDGSTTDTSSETSESITINCDKANGTVLSVTQNQIHTWNFSGTSTSGQPVSISSIVAFPQLSATAFMVQGSTVTFRPVSQTELSGSLTVNAISGSVSNSKTYSWQSGSSTSGGGFAGVMLQLLPKLMGVKTGYGNTGYGNTGYGNTGYGNTGYGNTGYGNTGYGNTGYGNTGYGGGIGGLGGLLGMFR